jgi:hypothetical protein
MGRNTERGSKEGGIKVIRNRRKEKGRRRRRGRRERERRWRRRGERREYTNRQSAEIDENIRERKNDKLDKEEI